MTTLIDRIEQLRELGVEVGTDSYWRGRPGEGRADDQWDGSLDEDDIACTAPEAEIVPIKVTVANGLEVMR